MKNKNLVFVLIIVGIVILVVIFRNVITKEPKIEPLTENDFKILGVSWDEDIGINGEGLDEWSERCDYCLKGILGTSDYSWVSKEIRCEWARIDLTLQSSKNLSVNISDEKLNYSPGYKFYLEGVSVNEVFIENLAIDENHDIIFCASDSDAFLSEDRNEICKSIKLEAKCPLN